jgi:hypothetical protein
MILNFLGEGVEALLGRGLKLFGKGGSWGVEAFWEGGS